jgi:hypothetical protein
VRPQREERRVDETRVSDSVSCSFPFWIGQVGGTSVSSKTAALREFTFSTILPRAILPSPARHRETDWPLSTSETP